METQDNTKRLRDLHLTKEREQKIFQKTNKQDFCNNIQRDGAVEPKQMTETAWEPK